jgi:Alcohol dehydrogenase GroES-like domain
MRAFAVRSFGDAPGIHDLPIPAADGGFLIHVRYAGVNPIDYKLVERLTANLAFPFVVGVDFAGVVDRVPSGEPDFRAGDRVFGMARTHGAYAEYTAIAPGVQAEALARIPDGVTDEQAAALPIAATTALGSIELLGVSARQRIVVMGATGGVGGYAVQMARSRGAHVIATVRGDVDGARRLGADEVYDTTTGHFVEALSVSHPEGVDTGPRSRQRLRRHPRRRRHSQARRQPRFNASHRRRRLVCQAPHQGAQHFVDHQSLVIAARAQRCCGHARGRDDDGADHLHNRAGRRGPATRQTSQNWAPRQSGHPPVGEEIRRARNPPTAASIP